MKCEGTDIDVVVVVVVVVVVLFNWVFRSSTPPGCGGRHKRHYS